MCSTKTGNDEVEQANKKYAWYATIGVLPPNVYISILLIVNLCPLSPLINLPVPILQVFAIEFSF